MTRRNKPIGASASIPAKKSMAASGIRERVEASLGFRLQYQLRAAE
jgi:hypothetical protein